jgi:hypothetical protein
MSQKCFSEGVSNTQPSDFAVSITDNNATHSQCRGVYVGTTQSIDLYVQNDFSDTSFGWITFSNVNAGSILPIMAKGARKTSDTSAPSAGDVVFLY